MNKWLQTRLETLRDQLANWLSMGMSPQRLALTLALGFAIGCLPLVGITTGLCLVVAIVLRLNIPVIQAANYAAMPLQLALIVPLMKLGSRLFASGQPPVLSRALFQGPVLQALRVSGKVAGQAIGAWVLIAVPAVVVITFALIPILRRVPALAPECSE